MAQGFEVLDSQDETDVVWAGDMNWNSDDGVPPLPAGWYEPSALSSTPCTHVCTVTTRCQCTECLQHGSCPIMLPHLLLTPAWLQDLFWVCSVRTCSDHYLGNKEGPTVNALELPNMWYVHKIAATYCKERLHMQG